MTSAQHAQAINATTLTNAMFSEVLLAEARGADAGRQARQYDDRRTPASPRRDQLSTSS